MSKVAPALMLLILFSTLTLAQDEREPEALAGRLQPAQVTELKVDLKAYSGELKIESILAPGSLVAEGDTIAVLAAADYAQQLERARNALKLVEWGLAPLVEGREHTERAFKQRHDAARRNAERAEEELKHFVDHGRARSVRNGELGLLSLEHSVADQKQELEQLKRLYKGNDLAEESQEIVLQRAYRRLEQTEERLKMSQDDHERFVNIVLPRRLEDLTSARDGAKLELERLDAEAARGNLEMQTRLVRAEQAVADAAKQLAELEADRERLTIKAPHAGTLAIGAWGGNDGAAATISVGDSTSRGAVLATVADCSSLKLSVNVKTSAREKFQPGTALQVLNEDSPVSTGTVKAIGFVVNRAGMVTAHIEVDNTGGTLLPGQKVSVKLTE